MCTLTRMTHRARLISLCQTALCLFVVLGTAGVARSETPLRDFSVDRQEVFEFEEKPRVAVDGDDVTITFVSKGFCDVTVVIEDSGGRIIRHLASGVLGPNAPEPFQQNSHRQKIVWDGKDDAGAYVDDKDAVTVRVSLGLKPRLERTLFWHPGKPSAQGDYSAFRGQRLALAAVPEGVLVFDSGQGVDHLRLFDRDGNYLRTIYPFPNQKIAEVEGLIYHQFPDGPNLPIKPNWLQSTFLQSDTNCVRLTYQDGQYRGYQSKEIATGGITGAAGNTIAAADGKVALVGRSFSRLATDGTSGGLNLHGPEVAHRPESPLTRDPRRRQGTLSFIRPQRAALSPDAKWLYVTRYNETFPGSFGNVQWRHMVKRIPYDGDGEPQFFAGKIEAGTADGEFHKPTDVACDAQGRVYVADNCNDRIQVFDPDGQHLRNIPVRRPAGINIHHETGEIFVFSWTMPRAGSQGYWGTRPAMESLEEARSYFRLTKFSALDDQAEELETWDLREATQLTRTRPSNIDINAILDTRSDPLKLWITAPSPPGARNQHGRGLLLLALENGEWSLERDLLDEAAKSITRVSPAVFNRQRLAVNPADGMLYLIEGDTSHGKAFKQVIRIDPQTGRTRAIDLPMSSEDLAFDPDGHAYLRSSGMIVRYDPDTWREVPFDYGEEHERHNYGSGGGERSARVLSGAIFPGNRGWHHGGMHISAKGDIVISALYSVEERERRSESVHTAEGFQPRMYPGRRYDYGGRFGGTLVHVLDRHGQMVHADAVPGLPATINGTAIDERGDIYLLHAAPAVIDGERHFNDHAGTLMKVTPGDNRLLAPSGAPVPLTERPDRPLDVRASLSASAWVEGAHWMYTGVGWGGFNAGTGCACPNARFALDYLARSFTPEIDRYNVGVLDSAGNLILRVGQYGNVDDGVPLVERGGPPNTRSIGGDETSLMFAPYVATHTDHRLFIADPGNARIVSVKLGYHVDERVALKDAAE